MDFEEKSGARADDELFDKKEEGLSDAQKRKKSFAVQEIVFVAICAAAGLLTSAVMPLVAHVPIYGIIQPFMAPKHGYLYLAAVIAAELLFGMGRYTLKILPAAVVLRWARRSSFLMSHWRIWTGPEQS